MSLAGSFISQPGETTRKVCVEVAGPVGQIHPQPWMTAPETRAVIDALAADGQEVRFIGGCVRDALLKRPVKDIDLALALPPDQVMARLDKAGIRAIPTGLSHGTVTAVVGATHFEITSLRVDVDTDGRHATIAFTDDWSADAARRDFTINALSCSPAGAIYDYVGGLEDLGTGHIRFVGDALERIREDALRLLRYFRFYAHYGRPPPDPDAISACAARATDVRNLSGERVRGEIFRILMATDPVDVLRLMQESGVLAEVLPEATNLSRLDRLAWIDSRALSLPTVSPDPTRRLAALIDANGGRADALADRLRFSNRERARLKAAVERRHQIDPAGDRLPLIRTLHRLGPTIARDLVLIAWAETLTTAPRRQRSQSEGWLDLLAVIDTWKPTVFPIKGSDAIALGVPRGPAVSRALKMVEDWWEAGGYQANREACLNRLREVLRDGVSDMKTTTWRRSL